MNGCQRTQHAVVAAVGQIVQQGNQVAVVVFRVAGQAGRPESRPRLSFLAPAFGNQQQDFQMRQRGFIRRQALRFLKGFPCRREIVLVAEHGGLALPAGRAQRFIRRRFQGVDKFLFLARRVGFQIATEQGIGCFFRSCIELGQVAEQVFEQGDGILLAAIFQPVSGDQGQGFRMQIENRQARQLLAGKLHQHLRQHQFLGNTQFWPVDRSTALLEFAARSAQARRVAFRSRLFPWPEAIFRNRRRVPDFQCY